MKLFLGAGFDDFVGEEALGIIGVIAARPSGTLDGPRRRRLCRACPFSSVIRLGELIFVAFEYVRRLCACGGARSAKGVFALGPEGGDS